MEEIEGACTGDENRWVYYCRVVVANFKSNTLSKSLAVVEFLISIPLYPKFHNCCITVKPVGLVH